MEIIKAKIGDGIFCDLLMGQSPPSETYNKNKTGLPFYQGKADFGLINPLPRIWCSKPKKIAEPNDILLSVRAPVGSTNIANESCAIGRGLAIIRSTEKLDYEYLLFVLRKFELEISTAGSGSTFDSIDKGDLKRISFPVPRLISDQRLIASQIKDKFATVEQMRQAALRQKEAVKALHQNQLNEIFDFSYYTDLKFIKLKSFKNIEISSGKAVSSVGGFYSSSGIPYLQVNNIDTKDGYISKKLVFIDELFHNRLKKSEVLKDDVLINIVGPPIGKVCWYPESQKTNINQAIVRVRCPQEINYKFLTYYLRTTKIYNYFLEVKVGVRQWNISSTNIGDIPIPQIAIKEQEDLIKKWESKDIRYLQNKIESQLEAIEALPVAILREVFEFKS